MNRKPRIADRHYRTRKYTIECTPRGSLWLVKVRGGDWCAYLRSHDFLWAAASAWQLLPFGCRGHPSLREAVATAVLEGRIEP